MVRWPRRRRRHRRRSSRPRRRPRRAAQTPTFRVSVDLITTDLIVRDNRDQFIADLKPGEIEVYEDGVKQDIASLELIHGGRAYSVQAPPPAPVQEGIILPRNRPTNDTAGRVFLLFIDDLHLGFRETPRTRDLLKKMLKSLIHDGDMFGIVTTGTSSISQQLTYDRQVLDSAISRITGNALKPSEIIQGGQGPNGPTELRHRAHVAFSTAYDLMRNLEKLQNRRKAVIYISSGYDFNPFEQGRLEEMAKRMHAGERQRAAKRSVLPQQQSQQMLAESDLDPRAGRADARRQPRQRHLLHHRPARPGGRAGSRRRSAAPRTGTSTSARRRTACACWPRKPAASRW